MHRGPVETVNRAAVTTLGKFRRSAVIAVVLTVTITSSAQPLLNATPSSSSIPMRRSLPNGSCMKIALLFRKRLHLHIPHARALLPIPLFALLFLSLRTERKTPSVAEQLQRTRIPFLTPQPQFQHYLSACVIIRDSSDLLPEFLIRNYLAGVDYFFLYGDDDNEQEKHRLEQIFSFLPDIVHYIPQGRKVPIDEEHPDSYVQMRMYRHCLQTYGSTSKWMALIDVDEFFETHSTSFTNNPPQSLSRTPFLHQVLAAHEMLPVLCVRWRTALTNGRLLPAKRIETLDERFPATCRMQVNNSEKLALRKPILQPQFVDFERTPKLDIAIHKGFKFKGVMSHMQCTWGIAGRVQPSVYLLHYWSRDLSSYLRKIQRGRPRKGVPSRTLVDLFNRERACSPEVLYGSSTVRRETVREFLKKMPFFSGSNSSFPGVHQVLGSYHNRADFSFCPERVALFISKLAQGMSFSDERYCTGRISEACQRLDEGYRHFWPYPWAEYLLSCDHSLDDSNFYV